MVSANEVRRQFLEFFKSKEHTIVPSASLLPYNDPTLIFTNAGMNQFKDVFLGTGKRDFKRAADSQKCLRVSGKHNDLDEVGRDTYHHTFFEMLGNWSFGDYYKKEAIMWAWELLTEKWGLPKDKMYATVFRTDDEAEELWKKHTDILPEHIMRFDEKDNFWEMGDTGPCGPCSEIHIDLGPERCDKQHIPGHVCSVNGDCARYIELWNLVFIQYNRKPDGSLEELPEKHVDTGMGFERIVSVIQNKRSNYDIDTFMDIINGIEAVVDQSYLEATDQVPFRVIADHIRTLTFAIADGALPSNEGRGYVLRRILRRASRFGRLLGMTEPFLYKIVDSVAKAMGEAYPELIQQQQHCELVIRTEEESFNRTLDKGIELFEEIVSKLAADGTQTIPGAEAFKLYDTYGFPLDLTQLMAEEKGLTVDLEGFEKEMAAQRARARESGKFAATEGVVKWETVNEFNGTEFKGYEQDEVTAKLALIAEDDKCLRVVFDKTSFYGESGGQVGDVGTIEVEGKSYEVLDTLKGNDRVIHILNKDCDFPKNAAEYRLTIDTERRAATACNHTGTHLLDAALRQILGDQVHQAGSMVSSERIRFDFNHFEKISDNKLRAIEDLVNKVIGQALPVTVTEMSHAQAVAMGAIALFGEKYGDVVRVVKAGDFSMELCGGTHVKNTAQLRLFRIVSESSVATGIRRIEAVTGEEALKLYLRERETATKLSQMLKIDSALIVEKVKTLVDDYQKLQKEMAQANQNEAAVEIEKLFDKIKACGNSKYVVAQIDGLGNDMLREATDKLRDKMQSGVVVLGSVVEDKVVLVVGVTKDLTAKVQAGSIIKQVAAVVGGSGGGRPDFAQAGGKEPAKLGEALNVGEQLILSMF